jgi:hypothetical protein
MVRIHHLPPPSQKGAALLLAELRIDDDGDRSVVDQIHLHIGAEFSGLNGLPGIGGQPLDKRFVDGHGDLRAGRAAVRWAVSFARAGKERELTHEKDFARGFRDALVHNTGTIWKNSQADDLAAQPFDVVRNIGFFDGQEHEQALFDSHFSEAANGDAGMTDALDYGAHVGSSKRVAVPSPVFGFNVREIEIDAFGRYAEILGQ